MDFSSWGEAIDNTIREKYETWFDGDWVQLTTECFNPTDAEIDELLGPELRMYYRQL